MTDELYETLNAPNWIKKDIDVTRAKMDKLRAMTSPKAIRYDKDNIQDSPRDKVSEFVQKMDELEQKLQDLEKDYIKAYNTLEKLIEQLDNQSYINIISLRYLAGYKYSDIADIMKYTEDHVYKIHRQAIKKMDSK